MNVSSGSTVACITGDRHIDRLGRPLARGERHGPGRRRSPDPQWLFRWAGAYLTVTGVLDAFDKVTVNAMFAVPGYPSAFDALPIDTDG